MIFLFLLGLCAALHSQTPATAAVGGTLPALRPDSLGLRDSVQADTAGSDSLRQGKAAGADSLAPQGNTDLWLGFSFLIPNAAELIKLRSTGENRNVAAAMDADARTRFDNNDITFPPEVGFLHRWKGAFAAGAGVGYWRIGNRAAWIPRPNDTVVTKRYVNAYRLQALPLDLWLRADLPQSLWTVERFNRVYLRGGITFFPWARLSTERTEVGKRVDAGGLGAGGEAALGLEKFLNPGASLTGELGYAWIKFSKWREGGGALREEDLFVNGATSPLALTFRNLRFRFTYTLWRPGT